jgi:hypothetical protein
MIPAISRNGTRLFLNSAARPFSPWENARRIKLLPNSGSDKSWVWNAFDFADGELVEKTFAIKFGSTDHAQEFKAKFEQAQKDMQQLLSGADTSTTTAESKAADEAAEAIDKLKVES